MKGLLFWQKEKNKQKSTTCKGALTFHEMLSPLTPPPPCPGSHRAAPSPLLLSFPLSWAAWGGGGAWLFGGGTSSPELLHKASASSGDGREPLRGLPRALGGLWDGELQSTELSGQWRLRKDDIKVGGREKRKGSGAPPTPHLPTASCAARGFPARCVCCQPGWKWLDERACPSLALFPSLCGILVRHWPSRL